MCDCFVSDTICAFYKMHEACGLSLALKVLSLLLCVLFHVS